ncbi:MAG: sigma factor, partial [Pseudomonadota bacterium]
MASDNGPTPTTSTDGLVPYDPMAVADASSDALPDADREAVGFDTLYRRLRAICGQRLQAERLEHTLQATALANEVWM